jgi:ABC-type dipeptide/oligopeptide/nickel transport system permease subunit
VARRAGILLAGLLTTAVVGPWLAPYAPGQAFRGFLHAPPMPPRVFEGLQVYPLRLEDRLEQRYGEDRSRTVPLPWRSAGPDPVFLLGADSFGRDMLSRVLAGARLSIGLGLSAVAGAMLVGALAGAVAGARGGWMDEAIMRVADFVLVLPVLYVVLVLRAVLPLVLAPGHVFLLMAAIFTAVGWPFVARGVRAIVAGEREREYVMAARALGAGTGRIVVRHLLPACAGHVAVQATVLLPAFILAEATLSYLGLGFPDTTPSWGTMLAEAANVTSMVRFPWTLTPALAIVAVTLVTNVTLQGRSDGIGGAVPARWRTIAGPGPARSTTWNDSHRMRHP